MLAELLNLLPEESLGHFGLGAKALFVAELRTEGPPLQITAAATEMLKLEEYVQYNDGQQHDAMELLLKLVNESCSLCGEGCEQNQEYFSLFTKNSKDCNHCGFMGEVDDRLECVRVFHATDVLFSMQHCLLALLHGDAVPCPL